MAAAGDTSVGGQVIKGGVEGVGDGERDRDRRKGRLGVHGVGPMVQGVGGAKYRHVCTVVSVVVDGGGPAASSLPTGRASRCRDHAGRSPASQSHGPLCSMCHASVVPVSLFWTAPT